MIDLALGKNLFITNKMDAAIQELDILFSTDKGQVIGDPYFGVDWYQFLYVLTPMTDSVKQYIQDALFNTYYCRQLNAQIDVQYVPGNVSCSYIVSVSLTDYNAPKDSPYRKANKVYTIQ